MPLEERMFTLQVKNIFIRNNNSSVTLILLYVKTEIYYQLQPNSPSLVYIFCVVVFNRFYSSNVVLQFIFRHHSMETQEIKCMCAYTKMVWSKMQSKQVPLVQQNVSR